MLFLLAAVAFLPSHLNAQRPDRPIPAWLLSAPLPADTAVRWSVEAFQVTGTDSVLVGAFEEIATFETAGPQH